MENKNETNMTLRLPNDLREKLLELAKKDNRSLHNLIITLLRQATSDK